MTRVGILAVQGAFAEHARAVAATGAEAFEIRQAADAARPMDALILPGGESTVQRKLLAELNLAAPLWALIDAGLPTLATCAGTILLARDVDGAPNPLGRADISVRRNAYGRQLGSFVTHAPFAGLDAVRQTFIRAPAITRTGPGVQVLSEHGGRPTAVRQDNLLLFAWHPELTVDPRLAAFFADFIRR